VNRPPAHKPEVKLDPGLQARLLEQMRTEQAAAIRSRRIKLFVLLPLTIALTVVSILMTFDRDPSTSTIGSFLASSLVMGFWTMRKRIGASLG